MSQQSSERPPSFSAEHPSANATSLDELVSRAAQQANEAAKRATPAPKVEEATREEKNGKKDKEKGKATKLIYSDNETSPEEKMARLSRYAFVPDERTETVMGDAVRPTVAGVVDPY